VRLLAEDACVVTDPANWLHEMHLWRINAHLMCMTRCGNEQNDPPAHRRRSGLAGGGALDVAAVHRALGQLEAAAPGAAGSALPGTGRQAAVPP
jgi:hypothetical protein